MNTSRANAKPARKPALSRNLLRNARPETGSVIRTYENSYGFLWSNGRAGDFINGATATETAHYPTVAQKM
jgi:hypothetical protein